MSNYPDRYQEIIGERKKARAKFATREAHEAWVRDAVKRLRDFGVANHLAGDREAAAFYIDVAADWEDVEFRMEGLLD